jgi:hypothetical protein
MNMNHESIVRVESRSIPGVSFLVLRMSLARRIDLTKRIRELGRKCEFLEAGGPDEQMEAAMLSQELDRIYVEWGLEGIEGLEIDGSPATPESMILRGPEGLCREAVDAVKAECYLSGEERKN